MQQTKRRSKKGVILLALAFAMLVLAIAPASAFAAAAIVKVNDVAAPTALIVGSTQVNLAYTPDSSWVAPTQVKIQESRDGGATWSSVAFTPGVTFDGTYNLTSYLPGPINNGDTFIIRVTWYNASNVALGSMMSGLITYDNSRAVSVLNMTAYSSWPYGDYNTQWFGPNGLVPFGSPPARGNFSTTGATPESINWQLDGGVWHHITYTLGVPNFVNPVEIYNGPVNGIHTVTHFAVAADTMLTQGPPTTNEFGWDSVGPRFTVNGPNAETWYGDAKINWDATVTDEPGSGVATATATLKRVDGTVLGVVGAKRLEWNWYQQQLNGTITPDATYDALNGTTAVGAVSFVATDYVNNVGTKNIKLKFDLTKPHTSFTVVPLLAGSVPPVGPPVPFVWTNKDVTVTFVATDPGAPTLGSGVARTEYFVATPR